MNITKIPVGISSCVLGNKVRYDSGHKLNKLCTEDLSHYFQYTAFCPEMESGMQSPRPNIRLINDAGATEAVIQKTGEIVTDRLKDIALKREAHINPLCGFIFTQKSPSCGVFRVKVYDKNEKLLPKVEVGIFAKAIKQKYPLMPLEEAERLNDAGIKENFILRVFAYHHWITQCEANLSKRAILNYYSQYKLIMMSHSQTHYKKIGLLLANMKIKEVSNISKEFIELFMDGLSIIPSRKNHTNTLMHIQGYFKKYFVGIEKQELAQLIMSYKNGHIPLITPITLIRHHLAKHPDKYLHEQKYLNPYPDQLGLRSYI